jgi:DnaK suppressor protein
MPFAQTMVAKEVEAYKRLLRAKEQELIRSIAKIDVDGRETSDVDTQDPVDKANGSIAKEYFFQQGDYDRAILGLVQAALGRADGGEFGACVACGQPVEKKRLEAVPWARHCIHCQDLQDKGLL